MSELSAHPAVAAVQQHAGNWNAQDRTAWLALFDDSFTDGRVWTLHPQRIIPGGTHEAAVEMLNKGTLHGELVELRGIEIYKVNDAGKIISVRAFFEQPTDFELNPFFVPEN
jgi:hypothetical protein